MAHIQIRNVPADVHRKLRAHAANAGQSVSEYALDELLRSVERDEDLDGLAPATTPPANGDSAHAEHSDDGADSAVDDSADG